MKWRTHKREKGELEKRKILNREKKYIFSIFIVIVAQQAKSGRVCKD